MIVRRAAPSNGKFKVRRMGKIKRDTWKSKFGNFKCEDMKCRMYRIHYHGNANNFGIDRFIDYSGIIITRIFILLKLLHIFWYNNLGNEGIFKCNIFRDVLEIMRTFA